MERAGPERRISKNLYPEPLRGASPEVGAEFEFPRARNARLAIVSAAGHSWQKKDLAIFVYRLKRRVVVNDAVDRDRYALFNLRLQGGKFRAEPLQQLARVFCLEFHVFGAV